MTRTDTVENVTFQLHCTFTLFSVKASSVSRRTQRAQPRTGPLSGTAHGVAV